MSSDQLSNSRISARYAKALYQSAISDKNFATLEKDLVVILNIANDSAEFKNAITTPALKPDQQKTLIDLIADKLNLRSKAVSFMKTLSENKRLYLLQDIIIQFFEVKAKAENRVSAKVESAEKLSASQTEILTRQLALQSGFNVELDTKINKDLIGGIKIIMGSLLIDSSVSGKLEMLRNNLKNSKNVEKQEVA